MRATGKPREVILLIAPPGAGKSFQLIKVCEYLKEFGIKMHAIDLEDKLEATLVSTGGIPKNMNLFIATDWEEVKKSLDEIEKECKPDEWIAVDRIDLAWPDVQRWYTQMKFQEELSERMMKKAMEMQKASMFLPRFDKSSWQVINEQYDTFMMSLLHKSKCNILLTAGIRGIDEDNPLDVFASLHVAPRGQKELQHQPHSALLLHQKKRGKDLSWHMTTGKDLIGREYFDSEELFDFGLQYLANVAKYPK